MGPMTDNTLRSGSCLCGGVSYEIRGELRPVHYCHCSQCRKTSGNFVAATGCDDEAFTLVSDSTLAWYCASDDARRGFCNVCGGNLFWKPNDEERIAIFAGTLDSTDGMVAEGHIFVADKADYFTIGDGLPQFEQYD